MNEAWNHFDFIGLKRNRMRTEFEQSCSATAAGPFVLILTNSVRQALNKNVHPMSWGGSGLGGQEM